MSGRARWRILCVGKLKTDALRQACEQYRTRILPYGGVDIIEVADERAPESLSRADQLRVLHAEGRRLQARLDSGECVALCIYGQSFNSETFARRMTHSRDLGRTVQFLIGGSLGLDDTLIRQADWSLSLSSLTYPHNLARLVLLEQLYRAARIERSEPYHK